LTKRDADKLVETYRHGMAVTDLCKAWNINRDTVYEHLRRAGIAANRLNKLGLRDLAVARELYQSGLSLATVAERLSVDAKTVRTGLAPV
jgi:hypothetical protein